MMDQTPASSPALDLLLAHADDGTPMLAEPLPLHLYSPGSDPSAAPPTVQRDDEDKGNTGASEKAPDSLPDQRWGLVVPAGPEGERIRDALKVLLRHRQEQLREPMQIFTLPSGLSGPAIERWIRDEYQDPAIDEEERPFYLLLAGDLTQIPLQLQLSLATGTEAYVGRLALPQLADYEAYADKVVRCETEAARSPADGGNGLFFAARDTSTAVLVGNSGLLRPCWQTLVKKQQAQSLPATLCQIDNQDEAALLRAARGAPPSLLFTLSHGLGAPKGGWPSAQAQREQQGAILCGTHPREVLLASDVRTGPFVAGGIWLMFACFGAATPQHSAFAPWLAELAKHQALGALDWVSKSLPPPGEPPFLAALPRAALSNPQGPLAVIGHVDLAFSYSFSEVGTKKSGRSARFSEAARMLLSGSRVGVALRKLHRDIARLSDGLLNPSAELADDPILEAQRRAYLRLQRDDLRYFILLGDPAARLPVAGPSAQQQLARHEL